MPRAGPITSGGVVLAATVAVAARLDRSSPAPDGSIRFSLAWLAGAYAVLFGLGAGAAAAVALAGTRRRSVAATLVVFPPLLPLVAGSRFCSAVRGTCGSPGPAPRCRTPVLSWSP